METKIESNNNNSSKTENSQKMELENNCLCPINTLYSAT